MSELALFLFIDFLYISRYHTTFISDCQFPISLEVIKQACQVMGEVKYINYSWNFDTSHDIIDMIILWHILYLLKKNVNLKCTFLVHGNIKHIIQATSILLLQDEPIHVYIYIYLHSPSLILFSVCINGNW